MKESRLMNAFMLLLFAGVLGFNLWGYTVLVMTFSVGVIPIALLGLNLLLTNFIINYTFKK